MGKRGPNPVQGTRQRCLQGWAERSEPPWETREVDWYGGKRKPLWVFARTGLWYTPRLPPVALRYVLVCDPEGKRRLAVCCWTNLDAPPAQILPWGVMRWSVEVTCEETRAYLRLETQRQWSDHALARTIPIRLALGSLVTGRAWQLSHGGHLPVPVTAWARTAEPPFADCLALVRGHLWRARYVVNSTPAAGVDAIAS